MFLIRIAMCILCTTLFMVYAKAQNQRVLDSLLDITKNGSSYDKILAQIKIGHELVYYNADSARHYAESALENNYTHNKLLLTETYMLLATVYQIKSNYDEALQYNYLARELAQEIQDTLRLANAYNNIGLVMDEQGYHAEAATNYNKAHEFYKQLHDDERMAIVSLNLGVVYKELGDFTSSLKNYQEAQEMFKSLNNAYAVAVCKVNLGSVYNELEQYDSAIKYSSQAESEFNNQGYGRFAAVAMGNTGVAYGKLNQFAKAVNLLNRAISLHRENNNSKGLSYCLLKLAEIQINIQPERAVESATEALEISTKANVKQEIADTHFILAKAYQKTGNLKEALHHQSEYIVLRDSLYQQNKVRQIRELQIKFDTERKERELAQSKMEIAVNELKITERNNQLILAGAISLMIIVFSFLMYRNQHHKQQKLLLKAQLAEARTQSALQEERLRISQELHDNIGSQLTFVNSSLEDLSNSITHEKFADIKKLTTDTIAELRKTVWLINHQSATLEEFITKLREYLHHTVGLEINLQFEGNGLQMIQAQEANHLFRIIQEAVNNTMKYAEATQLTIAITVDKQQVLRITINDNGKGFDTNASTIGFGLRSIRKRIDLLKGKLSIQSSPQGTAIYTEVPLMQA